MLNKAQTPSSSAMGSVGGHQSGISHSGYSSSPNTMTSPNASPMTVTPITAPGLKGSAQPSAGSGIPGSCITCSNALYYQGPDQSIALDPCTVLPSIMARPRNIFSPVQAATRPWLSTDTKPGGSAGWLSQCSNPLQCSPQPSNALDPIRRQGVISQAKD